MHIRKKRGSVAFVLCIAGLVLALSIITTNIVVNKTKLGLDMANTSRTRTILDGVSELVVSGVSSELEAINLDLQYLVSNGEGTLANEGEINCFGGLASGGLEYFADTNSTVLRLDILENEILNYYTNLGLDLDYVSAELIFSGEVSSLMSLVGLDTVYTDGNWESSVVPLSLPLVMSISYKGQELRCEYLIKSMELEWSVLNPEILVAPFTTFNATMRIYMGSMEADCTYYDLVREITASLGLEQESKRLVSVGMAGNESSGDSDMRYSILENCIKYSGYEYRAVHDSGCMKNPPAYLDCSSFVWKVYSESGLGTPLDVCHSMITSGTWEWIPASEAKPGDVLISVGPGPREGHAIVYAGQSADSDGYKVFEARKPGELSGCYDRTGDDWYLEDASPTNFEDGRYYFYRHKDLRETSEASC